MGRKSIRQRGDPSRALGSGREEEDFPFGCQYFAL